MKYKIGNTVCIKSMSDIGRIIDSKGCVGGLPFKVAMNNYCSSRMTIDQIDDISGYYRMKEDPWNFYNDEMIERLVEDLLDKEIQEHQRMCDEIMDIQGIEPIEAEMEQIIHCPDGYIFKDENGNVINAQKIVLEKKEEYPKTYEECCKVLGMTFDYPDIRMVSTEEFKLYSKFIQLKRCRDAYWKIVGEEMGLGKPWEPDYDSGVNKYGIICMNGVVQKSNPTTNWERHLNKVLDFPTEEMRDAFYENFTEEIEIEICKELL